jgi:glycolate oxidase
MQRNVAGFLNAMVGLDVVTGQEVAERFERDESHCPPQRPVAVVFAHTESDVMRVFQAASDWKVPVTPSGARTGKCGAAIAAKDGVLLSFEKMNAILSIDVEDMTATAQPGVVLKDLYAAVEKVGLFYPPDPNSWETCSLGGNVACNAGGPSALKYGVTGQYVLQMNWVLPDGRFIRVGRRTFKGVAGYDLTHLFVGSEGTLGVATEIVLKLLPTPRAVRTALFSFSSLRSAIEAGRQIFALGVLPRALELFDDVAVRAVRPHIDAVGLSAGAQAALIVELDGGSDDALLDELSRCVRATDPLETTVAGDQGQRAKIWNVRQSLSAALRRLHGLKISEDIVLPRSKVLTGIERFKAAGLAADLTVATYGHLGDGNLHTNVCFASETDRPRVESFVARMMEEVISLGGTVSGEHGIGLSKRAFLLSELGRAQYEVQRELRDFFDPSQISNWGKVFR